MKNVVVMIMVFSILHLLGCKKDTNETTAIEK